MSTKEEIAAAAQASGRTIEVEIGNAKATFRELSHDEARRLDESLWQYKDGKPLTKKDAEDGEEYKIPVDEPEWKFAERWIAATITPAFTVEEISQWPVSLRRRLLKEAQAVNNIEPAETIAKNS